VRDYAAAQGVSAERGLEDGLAAKAAEFKRSGESLYLPVLPAPSSAAAGAESISDARGNGSVG